MGSSRVTFRDRGYWAADAALEVWLHLLAGEVRRLPVAPEWLRRAAEHWDGQAHGGFVGCVSPALDEHVGGDAVRATLLLRVGHGARDALAARGPVLTAAALNDLGVGSAGDVFLRDVDAGPFLAVADAFLDLLRGHPSP